MKKIFCIFFIYVFMFFLGIVFTKVVFAATALVIAECPSANPPLNPNQLATISFMVNTGRDEVQSVLLSTNIESRQIVVPIADMRINVLTDLSGLASFSIVYDDVITPIVYDVSCSPAVPPVQAIDPKTISFIVGGLMGMAFAVGAATIK